MSQDFLPALVGRPVNRIEFKSWLCSRIKPFLEKAFNLNTEEYRLDIGETELEARLVDPGAAELVTDRQNK